MHCWNMNASNKIIYFSTVKRYTISGSTVVVLVHNMGSLPRHVDDILSDNRVMNNDIVGFIETQIKSSDFTYKIIQTLNFFNINFVNNENKIFKFSLEM